ncbi:hypothetical protein NHX12_021082 [Muraenolepis orangiensis]|uniref:Uncharacterized protein n=1 Tax=Muraenolepis orangiensis TaxID=630683 RepID=A0A9Q0IVS8_9TELE|nr:hypothetical protein NHX12_021082 [Muraenolepis orangiensis]
MGSEWLEKRKRQMQVHQEAAATVLHARDAMRKTPPTNASNACCFCWCCCCSCSWLDLTTITSTGYHTTSLRKSHTTHYIMI